jgi:hypothetical protein
MDQRLAQGRGVRQERPMAKDHAPGVTDDKQSQGLCTKGTSKERAAWSRRPEAAR